MAKERLGYILYGVIIDNKEIAVDTYKIDLDDYREIIRLGLIALHKQGRINAFDYQPKRSLKKG